MAAIMPPARDAEKGHTPSLSSDPPSATATTPAYDPDSAGGIDEKKLVRKIDLHVLPYICVMYLLAFLDRVNISNASLFGLQADLKLTGLQYNTALVIFFVPYIVFEIPSNVLLKRLRPHLWLSLCMFMFGLVTCLQGLTQNYGGLLTTRFFLGLFEAGMFPGSFYLLAMWYRRAESQKRFTFFFSSTTLAGAFGGLLASAIGKMEGVRGYRGWRWVFILEGILTCVFAIAWYFLLPDFPEEAKFLTTAERAAVKRRLAADVGQSSRNVHIGPRDVLAVFKDYKIFLGGLMYFGLIVPAYGYAYFAPTIIKTFHYTPIQTQLHSVPPWAAAFAFAMTLAFLSDRLRHRWLFSVLPALICAAGFAILLADPASSHVKYGALFLAAGGAYSSMPILVGWFNTNLAGHTRRAVGSAWQVGFGNIGGIIASYAFPAADSPKFKKGYGLCLGFVLLSVCASSAYFVGVSLENRKRDQAAAAAGVAGGDGKGVEEEEDGLGDLSPRYRYLT